MSTFHRRKSIRLKGYDYSQPGAYFVTICTKNRKAIFGDVVDGEMRMSQMGEIASRCWREIPDHFTNVELDEFVVMPNHVHGIIVILDDVNSVGVIHESPLPKTTTERRRMLLPKIIGRFKMNSAKRINLLRNSSGIPVWQRNYFEHIVRDEKSMTRIREYIDTNPQRWELDRENPHRRGSDEFDQWLPSMVPRPVTSETKSI